MVFVDAGNRHFGKKQMKKRVILDNFIYQYQRILEWKLRGKFDGRFVAMFHQVNDNSDEWYDNRYAISFSGFQTFVDNLQADGYEIVSPYDILDNDGKKKVVLSFDDAFDGVYHFVYPYLKQRNIPFVVFPAISKLQEKGYVDEKMLLEMTSQYQGCYVGAHSISHCNLRHLSEAESRKEIVESGEILEKLLERTIDIFAYPYGSLDAVGKRERKTAKHKYQISFGTVQGGVTDKVDWGYVPRVNVNEENYDALLLCRI